MKYWRNTVNPIERITMSSSFFEEGLCMPVLLPVSVCSPKLGRLYTKGRLSMSEDLADACLFLSFNGNLEVVKVR